MTDAEVVAAIRAKHLKANIDHFERDPEFWGRPDWDRAWVDPGGTIFGSGPYLHVPIVGGDADGTQQRVYAPERLRRKLAKVWPCPGGHGAACCGEYEMCRAAMEDS
jgi:hypothetical protein